MIHNPFKFLCVSRNRLSISAIAALITLLGCSIDNITTAHEVKESMWEGTWELIDPNSLRKITLIVRADKTVYVLAPLTFESAGKVGAVSLNKVSDNTEFPPGVEPISLIDVFEGRAIKAREAAAEIQLSSINRAQQAYRLENDTFASSIEALRIGQSSDLNNEHYEFRIVSADSTQAYATATAKQPELRSFSGVVHLIRENSQNYTKIKLCSTPSPSQTPPSISCEPHQ